MKTEERKKEDRELLRQYIDSGQPLEAFYKSNDLTPVKLSHKEIEDDLISQAIQKGYVKGCKVKCLLGWHERDGEKWINHPVCYRLGRDGTLWIYGIHHHNLCIFKDGNWAEFIKDETTTSSPKANGTLWIDRMESIRADMKELGVGIKKLKKDYKDLLKELD